MLTLQQMHQENISLLYRTHQIFCGIKGKDISLVTGNPPGRTDGETFVCIPIEDPEAELIHKHEWSHIFFKSNLRARTAFVDAYIQDLSKRVGLNVGMLDDFMHMLINGLDDIRVCSLWELIYPKSAEETAERWKHIILGSRRYQHDLVMYLMGLGLGIEKEMDRSEWTRYRSIILDAVQKVRRSGFPTCLITGRWIIDSILQDLPVMRSPTGYSAPLPQPAVFVDPTPSPTTPLGVRRTETQVKEQLDKSKLLQKMSDGARKTSHQTKVTNDNWKLMDTEPPTGPDPDRKGTEDTVKAALGISSQDQVTILLQQSQRDIDKIIAELKNHTVGLSPSQRLMRGLDGRVVFHDIKPQQAMELRLERKDEMLAQTMRHSFIRLMDRRKRVRCEAGTVLDPTAYLDLKMGSGDGAIFEEEEIARGFSSLVLLDMSGSMHSKWRSVSRACKVLSKAMKFPFSDFEVWGFTSEGGQASIVRFEDPGKGYEYEGMKWGLTPLHIAIEVGIRKVQMMPGSAQHLFILSDGMPTHIGCSSGLMAMTTDLVADISNKIEVARRQRVNVAALLCGHDVSDEVANVMFGSPRFWTRIEDEQQDLFEALVYLVRKAFVSYLRRS